MKAHWIGIAAAALLATAAFAASPAPVAEQTLATDSGCMECHSVSAAADRPLSGPAFRDIAAKYRNDASARAMLIRTVQKGGKGKWPASSGVPMPPYSPRLSDAEIRQLVDWVLRQ